MAKLILDVDFDADEIAPRLWQGSYPPEGKVLSERGFDALVLCAHRLQPPASTFPGIDVIHAPAFDDRENPISKPVLERAIEAAKIVTDHIHNGRNVLVTCLAGLNRSGLVSALTLHMLYGWSGSKCVKRVQERREDALFNLRFVEALQQLQAVPRNDRDRRYPRGM